jgi:formylglycine-generating enzyme required for sulfatase activity
MKRAAFLWICFLALASLSLEKEEKKMSEMIQIPAGEFTMGISKEQASQIVLDFYSPSALISPYLYYHEAEEHPAEVPAFRISRYEVTNREYKEFVDAGGYRNQEFWKELVEMPELNTDRVGWDRIQLFLDKSGKAGPSVWLNGAFPEGKADHPVEGVSWFEAVAYCRWKKMRLPSEAEWEYAARGTDKRLYPWGNDPKVFEKWGTRQAAETTAVGSIEEDKTPFGVMDMARNVAEWVTESWYLYPNSPRGKLEQEDDRIGILRGGMFMSLHPDIRTTCRKKTDKLRREPGTGFRCASD